MSKYTLVRWLGEETLSVMPANSVRSTHSSNVYPGGIADFKWGGGGGGGKYFEGEILALSGKYIIL